MTSSSRRPRPESFHRPSNIFESHALRPSALRVTNLFENAGIMRDPPPSIQNVMSNSFSTPNNLDPEAGFTHTPSVAQAANDLRAAAGEKAREFLHTAEEKATVIKERAIESAQQFRDSAAERATQFKAAASEKASVFNAAATDKAHQFKETAAEQWEDTRVKAKEFHGTAEEYIRDNPTKCVLSALGVGFLIGLIARR